MANGITDAELIAVLTAEGQSALAVWQRLGAWGETSVRNRLVDMAKAGIIDRYQVPIRSGSQFQWMYTLKLKS